MGQTFRETFGDAPIRKDLMDFFEDVIVERVMLKKSMNLVKIYISYDKMITKDHIYAMEQEMDAQMFSQRGLSVQIVEDFHLSEQYDTSYIVGHYYDSLLMELEHCDRLMHSVLRKLTPELRDDKLVLTLPDSFLARQKEGQIRSAFDKVFQERFHLPLTTVVEYTEAEESSYRKEMEQRAEIRLAAITKELAEAPAAAAEPDDAMLGEGAENTAAARAQAPVNKPSEKAPEKKEAPKAAGKSFEKKDFGNKDFKDGKSKKSGGGAFGSRDKLKMSDNPDVIYGRDFDGTAEPIETIVDEVGSVIIHGEVLAFDEVTFKTGNHLLKYTISDYTDSMRIKIFLPEELADEMRPQIKKGDFVLAKGMPKNDTFDKELELMNLYGLKKIKSFKEEREDFAVRKRVELHCHTKMSDMDACVEASDIVKCAKKFGHTAVALTDHGDVQGFPVAFHALDKKDPFKVLYGLEAYMVDDTKKIVVNEKGQSLSDAYVVFDIETTGFVPKMNKIIEIGAVKVVDGDEPVLNVDSEPEFEGRAYEYAHFALAHAAE